MLSEWLHKSVAALFIGLFIVLGQAWGASDFLARYLEMLGYSETEIEQLISGGARLTALDDAYRLEAMGYSPEEIRIPVSRTYAEHVHEFLNRVSL